jgi:2-keto-4-pentenoate hydratase/2-oxohepta-3-ene-1,7-dioic acid hydratase in catechol pathway
VELVRGAGSLIGSGTCQGGCILELSNRHGGDEYPWLAAGDEVTLAVERLGDSEGPHRPGTGTVAGAAIRL